MDVNEFAKAFPFGDQQPLSTQSAEEGRFKRAPLTSTTDALVQLGLPGPNEIAIWYALGLYEVAPFEVQSVESVERTLRVERVTSFQVRRLVEGSCGCLRILGLAPARRYQVVLTRAGAAPITL
ncbi:MAG: hypothetical protein RLZZ450_7233, partial [Pseudomonadota bacterium]